VKLTTTNIAKDVAIARVIYLTMANQYQKSAPKELFLKEKQKGGTGFHTKVRVLLDPRTRQTKTPSPKTAARKRANPLRGWTN